MPRGFGSATLRGLMNAVIVSLFNPQALTLNLGMVGRLMEISPKTLMLRSNGYVAIRSVR